MFKIAALATLAFLSHAAEQFKCGKEQIYNDKVGCMESCKGQKLSQCHPDNLSKETQDKFCGVNSKGRFEQFPKKCHPCLISSYIGVKKGSCKDNERKHKQEKEQKKLKEQSQNGKIHKHFCHENRNRCSDKSERQAQICGVTDKEKYIDFTRACKACQDESVDYYYRASCEDAKQLLKQEQEKVKQRGDHSDENNTCSADTDCKSYKYCKNSHCYDKCDKLKCDHGCNKGKCLQKQA